MGASGSDPMAAAWPWAGRSQPVSWCRFSRQMVHKAVMEVDESGTRAAAATGMVFAFRSAHMGSQKIVFNRPFLVAIMKAEDVLFLGKVARPVGGHSS